MNYIAKEQGIALNPKHIAIIMDGNGRWAAKRNLPRIAGHKAGADSVKEAIEACIENNISYLTLYAFSSENWSRPTKEVDGLMDLLGFYLGKELDQLHKNNVRLKIIGDKSLLSKKVSKQISDAEKLTYNNSGLMLVIALSYGSRQELVAASANIAQDAIDRKLNPAELTEELFSKYLYTADIPDPDLIIRTSGEKRISNFLLWQIAYSELLFIDILWPDFKKHHIVEALAEFTKRDRRYGTS